MTNNVRQCQRQQLNQLHSNSNDEYYDIIYIDVCKFTTECVTLTFIIASSLESILDQLDSCIINCATIAIAGLP
jgi:hypothetical protein